MVSAFRDVAHLGFVELYTPDFDKSLWFFTELSRNPADAPGASDRPLRVRTSSAAASAPASRSPATASVAT